LLTAGKLEGGLYQWASMNQFPGTLPQAIQMFLFSRDHHLKVIGRLVAHQAVDDKQAYGLIHRHASIRVCFHFETLRASPLINEHEGFRMNGEVLSRAMAFLETLSAVHW